MSDDTKSYTVSYDAIGYGTDDEGKKRVVFSTKEFAYWFTSQEARHLAKLLLVTAEFIETDGDKNE